MIFQIIWLWYTFTLIESYYFLESMWCLRPMVYFSLGGGNVTYWFLLSIGTRYFVWMRVVLVPSTELLHCPTFLRFHEKYTFLVFLSLCDRFRPHFLIGWRLCTIFSDGLVRQSRVSCCWTVVVWWCLCLYSSLDDWLRMVGYCMFFMYSLI